MGKRTELKGVHSRCLFHPIEPSHATVVKILLACGKLVSSPPVLENRAEREVNGNNRPIAGKARNRIQITYLDRPGDVGLFGA